METYKNDKEFAQSYALEPIWYEKKAKRFLIIRSRIICLIYCLYFFLFSTVLLGIIATGYQIETKTSGIDGWKFLSDYYLFLLVIIFLYAMFFISLWNTIFPLRKCLNHMDDWGNRQEIYRFICMEFLDRKHPPKKNLQLWVTPHFILLGPYAFMPMLYYLPSMTHKQHLMRGDILHFSDGSKISYKNVRTKSRKILDDAIAPYQNAFVPEGKKTT